MPRRIGTRTRARNVAWSSGTWTWLSPLASQATTFQATLARAASLVGGTRLGDAESKAAPDRPGVDCGIKGIRPGVVDLAPAYLSIAPAPLARRWARRYRGGSMAMASTS